MLKKILITALLTCAYLLGGFAPAAEAALLRVALVTGQTTAEISCDDEFEVQSGWQKTVMPKGKYFLFIKDNRLFMEAVTERKISAAKIEPHVSTDPIKQKTADTDNLSKRYDWGSSIYLAGLGDKKAPGVNQRQYNGHLRAMVADGKLLVVNYVDMEQYLCSVLPNKTMVVWPDEAIKAQAVAARSYAMYMQRVNVNKQYDLPANDTELVYEGTGLRIEKAAINKLVQATKGQFVADAAGLPIQAVSTSSTGGRTESALAAWGKNIAYLQSVKDFDSDSPDFTWEYRATPSLLEGQLAQRGYTVGRLTSVRLSPLEDMGADRTDTGRVKYLILTGTGGAAKISGEELAEILSLKSTLFDVETGVPTPEVLKVPIEDRFGFKVGSKDINIKVNDEDKDKPAVSSILRSYHMLNGGKDEKIIFHGKGKGSGLGLSAWGARGMVNATEKITYKDILAHYYPGTYVRK